MPQFFITSGVMFGLMVVRVCSAQLCFVGAGMTVFMGAIIHGHAILAGGPPETEVTVRRLLFQRTVGSFVPF